MLIPCTEYTDYMNLKNFLSAIGLIVTANLAMAEDGTFSGKVTETTNVSSYTYVCVDTGSNKLWAATTEFPVKTGDKVTVYGGMPMANFYSKSLGRKFDTVYFTGKITVEGGAESAPAFPPGHPPVPGSASPTLPPNHPSISTPSETPKMDLSNIKPAKGGQTIKQIYAGEAKLAGTTISVRGKVVKYNSMILGKNWLHLQDGTGLAASDNNDLMVTTDASAAVGDTVLVSGKVSTNRDFGAGYKYSVMIEDAKVTVEK